MSKPAVQRSRSRLIGAITALVVVVPLGLTALPAQAAERTVTLAGSLQSELGCQRDWDQTCPATDLTQDPTGQHLSGNLHDPRWLVHVQSGDQRLVGRELRRRRRRDGANIPLVIAGPASSSSPTTTQHIVTVAPTDLPTATGDRRRRRMPATSLRKPLTREQFYFVMADRFANGDHANDDGGLPAAGSTTGLRPDRQGLLPRRRPRRAASASSTTSRALGTTAIWLTPSFKNRPVQGSGANASAGLPRLLDHRLHPDRPAPRHQRRHEGPDRRGPRARG